MTYWQKQTNEKPLFPEIEWNKPERRNQAGKLGIVGGNKLSFAAVAESYATANSAGAGEIRVLLPDGLRGVVPKTMTDVIFGPSTPSGGLASDSKSQLLTIGEWADTLLLIGDAGKNSQTAIIYEDLVADYNKPIVITRDAIDLLQNSFANILDNSNITLVVSFAQLQRLFRAVYYPKILTFSMQLAQFIETVHKFTITYPVTIMTFHAGNLIIARNGEVVSQVWNDPMRIWRGHTAARGASYLLWNPNRSLESLSASAFSGTIR